MASGCPGSVSEVVGDTPPMTRRAARCHSPGEKSGLGPRRRGIDRKIDPNCLGATSGVGLESGAVQAGQDRRRDPRAAKSALRNEANGYLGSLSGWGRIDMAWYAASTRHG